MKLGWMVGAWALVLASAAVVRADPATSREGSLQTRPPVLSGEVQPQPVQADSAETGGKPFDPRARPVRGRVGLVESQLRPAERTEEMPPNWTGDIDRTSRPAWVDEHLEQHRRYVEPFIVSPVYPEVSARLINMGGWNPRTRSVDVDQLLYVSLYALEFYAPLLTLRSADTFNVDHYRVNLRLPAVFGRQAVALYFGANLPVRGTLAATGGYNTMLGYAWGGPLVSFQAKLGYGVDRLIGEEEEPLLSTGLADVSVGLKLGDHAQLVVGADGKKLIGRAGGAVRVWPGVRFFPMHDPSLSVGVAGLWWADDLAPGGDFGTRRAGATIDLGYVFL